MDGSAEARLREERRDCRKARDMPFVSASIATENGLPVQQRRCEILRTEKRNIHNHLPMVRGAREFSCASCTNGIITTFVVFWGYG